MTRARLAPPARSAVRQLVDAVLALSDDPGPVNVERYLRAGRALEESRAPRAPAPKTRRRSPEIRYTAEAARQGRS